jgi:hypothetical protein
MAISVTYDFEGATLDQYDQVLERLGLTKGGHAAPGGTIFHWVAKTDTGIRVCDVWESREQFDRFAQEQIGPITQEVGFPGPPKGMEFFEVHNTLTAGPAV